MKYFIDFEFIEGFRRHRRFGLLPGRDVHFIDMISVGIVCEDGREYYAVSSEYNYSDADDWVKENVIVPAYKYSVSGDQRNHISAYNFHKTRGKSISVIAGEVIRFCTVKVINHPEILGLHKPVNVSPPQFYGYYADYDWVVFCSMFGRMINLPPGFPMYCRDLKQSLDEYLERKGLYINGIAVPDFDIKGKLSFIKSLSDMAFPKEKCEHLAICDARFNRDLYYWLEKQKEGKPSSGVPS